MQKLFAMKSQTLFIVEEILGGWGKRREEKNFLKKRKKEEARKDQRSGGTSAQDRVVHLSGEKKGGALH